MAKANAFNPNGLVIYRGPSMIDRVNIVAIATGFDKDSSNSKTGSLIQVFIMLEEVSPRDAVNRGLDGSICGNCPHRGRMEWIKGELKNTARACYVQIDYAPRNTWETYHRGRYAEALSADELRAAFAGRKVRLGAYGDPAAVPFWVWEAIMSVALGGTGYTHQWRTHPELRAYCMASCDTAEDYHAAKAAGWRTFRVKATTDEYFAREIACPASEEKGKKTQCDACRACGGLESRARVDIAINAHGSAANVKAYAAQIAA